MDNNFFLLLTLLLLPSVIEVFPWSTPASDKDLNGYLSSTTESCECYPCDEVLDTEEDIEVCETRTNWTVSSSFKYFNTSKAIEEAMKSDFPPDFNFSNFGNANGIWVLYNNGASPRPAQRPSIVFESGNPHDILRVTFYLYGSNSSLLVYIGDEEPREVHSLEEQSWDVFHWQPFRSSKVRIEVSLGDDEGSFAFIDKVHASLSDCSGSAPSDPPASFRKEFCPCGPASTPSASLSTTIEEATTSKSVPPSTTINPGPTTTTTQPSTTSGLDTDTQMSYISKSLLFITLCVNLYVCI